MSDSLAETTAGMCCANCGVAEMDDVKLKKCTACKSVRYCGRQCQKDHRPKHKRACKQRAAELRDEILFRQNKSSDRGDCPICCLPLPLGTGKSMLTPCCCKLICRGCDFANHMHAKKGGVKPRCEFCRLPISLHIKTEEEYKPSYEKRAEVNDPAALSKLGRMTYDEGNYDCAFEYSTRAAELGDAMAHFNLAVMYHNGEGVEKNAKMETYHMEEAAIGGHCYARYNLGCYEQSSKKFDRAVKHWIIAANLGHDDSLRALKGCYKKGHVSKDDFAAALRAHQAAVEAMKSPQRKTAEEFCAMISI